MFNPLLLQMSKAMAGFGGGYGSYPSSKTTHYPVAQAKKAEAPKAAPVEGTITNKPEGSTEQQKPASAETGQGNA
jgi:hypothetical protein